MGADLLTLSPGIKLRDRDSPVSAGLFTLYAKGLAFRATSPEADLSLNGLFSIRGKMLLKLG